MRFQGDGQAGPIALGCRVKGRCRQAAALKWKVENDRYCSVGRASYSATYRPVSPEELDISSLLGEAAALAVAVVCDFCLSPPPPPKHTAALRSAWHDPAPQAWGPTSPRTGWRRGWDTARATTPLFHPTAAAAAATPTTISGSASRLSTLTCAAASPRWPT